MVLEVFLQACIISLINIWFPSFHNKTQAFSFLFAVGVFIGMLVFMMLIIFYLCLNYSRLNIFREQHGREYFSLFSDFKFGSWIIMGYNFFFCLWRLLYAMVIVLLINWPIAQGVLFLLLTIPVVFYQLIFRPFNTFWGNFFGFFNEVVLVINGIGFFFFLTPNTGKV